MWLLPRRQKKSRCRSSNGLSGSWLAAYSLVVAISPGNRDWLVRPLIRGLRLPSRFPRKSRNQHRWKPAAAEPDPAPEPAAETEPEAEPVAEPEPAPEPEPDPEPAFVDKPDVFADTSKGLVHRQPQMLALKGGEFRMGSNGLLSPDEAPQAGQCSTLHGVNLRSDHCRLRALCQG